MEPSLDDPWAELSVVKPLGAAYSINSNWVPSVSRIAQFEGDEADHLISYLFSGRWDRSTICAGHQRYGQF
jgi:acetoacetate decarboxylase